MMLWLRKVHKWISLLVGLQVLLWLLSGLVISLLDPAKVNGRQWMAPVSHEARTIPSEPVLEPGELPPHYLAAALAISLVEKDGKAVYRIRYPDSEILFNANDGAVLTTGKTAAEGLATRDFIGDGEIIATTSGVAPDRETRKHNTPYWRIDFSDDAATTVYISKASGEILERRNDHWRLHDFFWMLHIMDYSDREDLNNPLVIAAGFVAVWLGLSGFLLLFTSFTRRDFRFLTPLRRPYSRD